MQEIFTWIWQSLYSAMLFVRAVAYEWIECFVLIFLLGVQASISWWVFFTFHMGCLRRVKQVQTPEKRNFGLEGLLRKLRLHAFDVRASGCPFHVRPCLML